MSLFQPDLILNSVTDITPALLQHFQVDGILLDIDNTLATHNHPVPAKGVMEWVALMKDEGVPMVIVSNNSHERVKKFADQFPLPFVSKGKKPLPVGNKTACRMMGIKPSGALVVGDQVFTDVLGGRLIGARVVMTRPITLEDVFFFRVKRVLEKPFLNRYYKKHKGDFN